MDKALACHTGGWGSNLDMTKVYSAPILLGPPAMGTLSHNACRHELQHEYLLQGGKKRGNIESWLNSCHVWEKGGVKKRIL